MKSDWTTLPWQALSWLLATPGASNTVLEATTPYSRRSLLLALGKVNRSHSYDIVNCKAQYLAVIVIWNLFVKVLSHIHLVLQQISRPVMKSVPAISEDAIPLKE